MIRCVIVDDEALARSLIRNYLGHFSGFEVKAECTSALEAIQYLAKNEIDLLFLDINMNNMSGIELLKQLPTKPMTILCTAYSEYALESYDLDVLDYLLKPIGLARFGKAISKVLQLKGEGNSSNSIAINAQVKSFFVKSEYKKIKIEPDDIRYIEAMEKYVRIHLSDKKVMTLMSMSKIMSLLDNTQFLRLHRSYIVNKQYISAVEGNMVTINDQKIPVSKANKYIIQEITKS